MQRGQSSSPKGKSPKGAPDLNTGSSKRRKHNETDKNGTAIAQRPELRGNSSERSSTVPNPAESRMDIDIVNQESATSSQERMDTITKASDKPPQDLIRLQKLFAENVLLIDVDFSKKASKEEAGLSKVLEAETAMRNTCGGVIILNNRAAQAESFQDRDKWLSKLQEMRNKKLSQVRDRDTVEEILDFEGLNKIFVRKSSIVLTEESKCLLQRCETRNQRVTSYPVICSILKGEKTTCCCVSDENKMTSFILDSKMPFPESRIAEFKHLTGKDLATLLRKELREYVVAFANTAGGTIYFGVKDDASIVGQKVNNEENKNICLKIEECLSSKLWIQYSGKEVKPVKDQHYNYEFFPVDGAEDNTFVIGIHICKFGGNVFLEKPISHVLNEDNKIVQMDFEKWMGLHKPSLTDNNDYRERFEKRKRGTFTYYSVKETVKEFVANLTSASQGKLKLHPSHAVKWIKHQALDMFVETTKETFKENKWQSGIAYIERCWEVNLGLPSTKPDDVICDVLMSCPQMPLVFVSLTNSGNPSEASCSYNRKVAAKLKAALVQEAGCLEKFYIKPVVISHQQLVSEDAAWIYSETPLYPKTYKMNNDKYYKVLEALVLVLARANVMASHIVGQGLFNLLTYEQYKILHGFYEHSYKVQITGPPGSGKTVLALERIRRLRNTGCSYDEVLFLCSNKPLKARVKNMMTGDGQSLCIVMTYHEMNSLFKSDAGFNIKLGNIKHILADEAQNFQVGDSLDWWSKLHALCNDRDCSSFWVFFDLAQKINNNSVVSLKEFSKKELKTVIRQTRNVHRLITSKYIEVDPQVKVGHDFDGQRIDVLVPSTSNADCRMELHLMYILISQLHKLIIKDGHHLNDITVLFSDSKQKDFYQNLFVQRTKFSCPIRNGEEVSKNGVVFDTIRRYCGVDANIVIGFCPEYYNSDSQDNNALMTALCSRTKLKLILILKNEEEADNFDLAPEKLKRQSALVKCASVKFGNIKGVSNFSMQ
ncbi:schlafen family member 8-like [Actinia tenebrosa]|uniref:Schlafen family member 8-like n=1 Tax=Actinia tenebrosa TaxID=6105 RepID=A0A6P8ISN4_ACTTE|nr:schlafen family member 8-like [Actinia tenebrosa]XP_031569321.1 schlafen family member 8-like [Actinia tenebrosa]